jgi:hypothetical protein
MHMHMAGQCFVSAVTLEACISKPERLFQYTCMQEMSSPYYTCMHAIPVDAGWHFTAAAACKLTPFLLLERELAQTSD